MAASAVAWGWRQVTIGTGEYQRTDWQPQGVRAGWTAQDDLYLDLEAALTAVQRVGQATGSSIGVSPKTLTKRRRPWPSINNRGFCVLLEKLCSVSSAVPRWS